MHLCLTVECITSGLHLSVFLTRSHPSPTTTELRGPPDGVGGALFL